MSGRDILDTCKHAERRWLSNKQSVGANDASPMWASPEALAGDAQTDRADVFSMCTVLCVHLVASAKPVQ